MYAFFEHAQDEFCAYKVDLAKAYDRMDWHFLKCMMGIMGFASVWMNWIMTCVMSVNFLMHFNGQLLVRSLLHVVSGKGILYLRIYS